MLAIPIFEEDYRIVDHPGPLLGDEGGRYRFKIDHEQQVIWIDPDVTLSERPRLYALATACAWRERLCLETAV